jgi:hypothetical protein
MGMFAQAQRYLQEHVIARAHLSKADEVSDEAIEVAHAHGGYRAAPTDCGCAVMRHHSGDAGAYARAQSPNRPDDTSRRVGPIVA